MSRIIRNELEMAKDAASEVPRAVENQKEQGDA